MAFPVLHSDAMKDYLDLVRFVLEEGAWQNNRTGVRTLSVPGVSMRLDLQHGFPAVTTKRLAFRMAMGELVGFLRGVDSAAGFRELGCRVWDQNANENAQWLANPYRDGPDDLGPVYGVQWRRWPAFKLLDPEGPQGAARIAAAAGQGFETLGTVAAPGDGTSMSAAAPPRVLMHRSVDQIRRCLDTIETNPTDRRILFHGWNWAQLDEMALPPCHLLYQFLANPERRELSMCLYVRSNDLGLGTPFNLAEGAALMHLVGRLTGYRPRWFSYFIGDAHIYENHLDMVREQLTREPYPLPRLVLSDRIPDRAVTGRYEPQWIERIEPEDFSLEEYRHHPPITAPMAV